MTSDKKAGRSSSNNMVIATLLVMLGLVFSKGSGFLRDIFVGIKFSDPVFRDGFTLAFTIPDLVYNLLIGGSIQSAITPSLSAAVASGKEKEGIRTVSIFISFFSVLLVAVCALGVIFSHPLYSLFGNGERSAMTIDLAASASRWLFPQIVFMMLAALCIGILNAYKRFGSTAFGPTIYNVCVLIAILVFAGNSLPQLMRTTFGIMLAAAVYFLYQAIVGRDKLKQFRFIWAPGDAGFHKLVRRALPILISASVVQLNMLILNYFAIKLPDDGNVFALRNASTTWQLPYGIFAVAIGNVMLPSLAEFYGKKDFKGASELLSSRLRSALFLTIPSAGFMFIMNTDVIKAIFKWSPAYTDYDARRAGALLAGYSIAIITHSVVFIMNQAFYAIGKTKVPLMAGCIGLLTNPICCTLLMPSLGAMGLTLSYSVTSILQMTVLCVVYCRNKELRPHGMLTFIGKCALTLVIMCATLFVLNMYYPAPVGKVNELIAISVKFVAAGALYFALTVVFRVKESSEWISKALKLVRKSH
ncbi:MAG: murein biosynthesis integral membrane protein MurJ [Clostridiales bacterium]|nr:murein biosynthesis integral membrane protein MurJ [Clostridiales bacterium]